MNQTPDRKYVGDGRIKFIKGQFNKYFPNNFTHSVDVFLDRLEARESL